MSLTSVSGFRQTNMTANPDYCEAMCFGPQDPDEIEIQNTDLNLNRYLGFKSVKSLTLREHSGYVVEKLHYFCGLIYTVYQIYLRRCRPTV